LIDSTKATLETENTKEGDITTGNGVPVPSPGIGIDADSAPGLTMAFGQCAEFTFIVTNGGMVALTNVVVIDNNATPADATDDFSPAPVLSGGYNLGDLDHDNRLDPGEAWLYTSKSVVVTGQYRCGDRKRSCCERISHDFHGYR
jgi:hypothetical protein